jgi:hypothetical protein
MALEGLYVPINADWYPALRSELLSFPAGKHDDQVDALGLGRSVARSHAGGTKAEEAREAEEPERLRPAKADCKRW